MRLPEALAHRLEKLAEEEGISLDSFVRCLLSEHGERRRAVSRDTGRSPEGASFPVIPEEETGAILPVTGADLDEMFAFYAFATRR